MQIGAATQVATPPPALSTSLRNLRTIDAQMALAIAASPAFKGGIVLKALAGLDEHLSDMETVLIGKTEGHGDAES